MPFLRRKPALRILLALASAVAPLAHASDALAPLPFDHLDQALCPTSGSAVLWGRHLVGADLVGPELKRLGLGPGFGKVAVIDTGFDTAGNRKYLDVASHRTANGIPGNPDAGHPDLDESGHGTGTTGLIGAGLGLGFAPGVDLITYRAAVKVGREKKIADKKYTGLRPDVAAIFRDSEVLKAVTRACADGYPVISLSYVYWGETYDELGREPMEQFAPDFLRGLERKGCILALAAGNDARRDSRPFDHPDDALLRVGALGPFLDLARYPLGRGSSLGEVYAPGDQIAILLSGHPLARAQAAGMPGCPGLPGHFDGGTSFSAPIVAALLAEVRAVLARAPAFGDLPPPEQVKLLNRVVLASRRFGSPNFIRALLIAERWSGATVPSADALTALLGAYPDPQCAEPVCDPAADPTCLNRLRRRFMACPGPELEAAGRLVSAFEGFGYLEQAAAYRRHLTSAGVKTPAHARWADWVAPYTDPIALNADRLLEYFVLLRKEGALVESQPDNSGMEEPVARHLTAVLTDQYRHHDAVRESRVEPLLRHLQREGLLGRIFFAPNPASANLRAEFRKGPGLGSSDARSLLFTLLPTAEPFAPQPASW